MFDFLTDFHFIRPLWFLAFVPMLLAVWSLKRISLSQSGWTKIIPNHLTAVLLGTETSFKKMSVWRPMLLGILIICSLAGPTWEKRPQPVFKLNKGSVLIMDMSYSMLSTDVSPNRMTLARYKAIDLLNNLNEGEMGLIAYAGDAFVISPLTDDINNIKLLLPSLTPEIMPELGSYPIAALELAHNMLTNAGHINGDIYWFTDGIESGDLIDINRWLSSHGHNVNILGVGTMSGAPIQLSNGQLMKDETGAIVIPKLSANALAELATKGKGVYQTITSDNTDINALVKQSMLPEDNEADTETKDNYGDQWEEFGPYVLLLALPLMLSYFRRGVLLCLIPISLLLTPTQQAQAGWWQDLWQTKDQQGAVKFSNDNYTDAAQTFDDPMWQGSSHFKAGDYESALKAFQQVDSDASYFNQGNSFAKLQQFDQAIEAYEKALTLNPEHTDAQFNKALVEKLKQDQENQQQQSGDQQQQEKSENQDQTNQDQKQQDQSQNGEQQSDEQQQQDQQQQSQDEQSGQENKDKNAENKPQEGEQQEENMQEIQAKEGELTDEEKQKYEQLLRKVTDDPYLLLRNKMQLEYQKRRQERSHVGAKKKW